MMTLSKVTVLTVALTALAACGGGGGGGGVANPIPEYVTFTNPTFATTSTLGGRVLVLVDPAVDIRELSGLLRHNTRQLTDLTDGETILTAGRDNSGTWTNGTVTFEPADLVAGSYGFAAFYNLIDKTSDGLPGKIAIVGVTTDASDVPEVNPSTGKALFSGNAFIGGSTVSDGTVSLTSVGTSQVEVDFEAGRASLTISDVRDVPYSSLTITDMLFLSDRSAFGGGTFALLDASGTSVTDTLLGAGFSHEAFGDFFGIDSNDIPANVGGLFQANGDAGKIFGAFLAD